MTAGLIFHAGERPDAVAVRAGDRAVTFGELDDLARRLSHVLAGLGVTRGGAVAIMLPNGIEFLGALHAAGRLGAVAVPVNTHFKADEAGWVVSDSGAQAVVVATEFLPALGGVAELPRLVLGASEAGVDASDFAAAVEDAPSTGEVDPPELVGDGWPTTMAYTSGTTGRPKGVALGSDDFRTTAEGYAAMGTRWDFGSEDVHLLVGPMYHSGPLAWGQMHLAFGGSMVIMAKWNARECLAVIERHGVTSTHMVPANFSHLLELPDDERAAADLSSVKMFVHAAAPCPIPLKRAFMDFVGADRVWEYYGASEGGGTVISPQEWLAHPGSVGRPFPGNEFAIFDDDGNRLAPGAVGTVYARPSSSSFEYHNDPDKTAKAHYDGFFTVGDAGYLDEDGYLYLADRKSDMVISGGVNIYPREIEDVLFRHEDITDVAVFGVPDDQWGEALLAMVQLRPGAALRAEDVVEYVRERLADFKRPRHVEFVEELPRDPNGKVRKPKLREAWIARQSPAV